MITILGTSHISKQSSKEVKEAIEETDIVCIELDAGRAQGLLEKKQATFKELRQALGLKAAIMTSILRSLQQRLAKDVDVLPGVEMRTALLAAMQGGKQIFLIDRDIRTTMQRLSKAFGWGEAWQLVKDFRPRKIPIHPDDDLVLQLMKELKQHYPRIYKVMVSERDKYMAAALVEIQLANPEKRVLVVVGKGHVSGMLKEINYINHSVPVNMWNSQEKRFKPLSL